MIRTLALLAAFAVLTGCERRPPSPPPPPVELAWTPERIATEPAGYLQYAQGRVLEQTRLREQKLAELGRRKKEVDEKSADLLRRVEEARNLGRRLETAIQRAEDEERWPLQFAGRSFSRDRAKALSLAVLDFEKQREPLADAYRDALRRLEQSERALRADIGNLGRVGERLALDLERVRLNQGLAEMTELRQTEAELANFSADLSALTEDPLDGLSLVGDDPVDLNDLLKP